MKHRSRKPDITETHPRIAAEWDRERNETGPTDVSSGSDSEVWWRCSVEGCGHRWQARVRNRTRGTGCPKCRWRPASGRSLADKHPELAAQWHHERNLDTTPRDVAPGSRKKVWWRCLEPGCGHSWAASLKNRAYNNSGCPACAGQTVTATNSLAARRPDLAAQWDGEANGELKPDDVTTGSAKRAWWRCPVDDCGHRWQAVVNSRKRGTGCPNCAYRRRRRTGRDTDRKPDNRTTT